jgi:hypothetical protein
MADYRIYRSYTSLLLSSGLDATKQIGKPLKLSKKIVPFLNGSVISSYLECTHAAHKIYGSNSRKLTRSPIHRYEWILSLIDNRTGIIRSPGITSLVVSFKIQNGKPNHIGSISPWLTIP